MSFYKSMLLVFTFLGLWACQKSADGSAVQQTKDIIVYGSNTCDHCIRFKSQLDSVGLSYDFRDVDVNYAFANEMINKVQAARIMGQINYPVVDIEGKILVTPEMKEVMALVK